MELEKCLRGYDLFESETEMGKRVEVSNRVVDMMLQSSTRPKRGSEDAGASGVARGRDRYSGPLPGQRSEVKAEERPERGRVQDWVDGVVVEWW